MRGGVPRWLPEGRTLSVQPGNQWMYAFSPALSGLLLPWLAAGLEPWLPLLLLLLNPICAMGPLAVDALLLNVCTCTGH